jgi:RNA polymerase sigma-70 factor (ECF subfamily)
MASICSFMGAAGIAGMCAKVKDGSETRAPRNRDFHAGPPPGFRATLSPGPMSDEPPAIRSELIAAAARGDESAWREIIERLSPRVFSIIRNHLRRRDDHEDVAQEVFAKLFLRLGQFRGRQPFEHWVSRVALNTCRDWLRRGRARPAVSWSELPTDQAELLERTLATDGPAPDENPALLRDFLDRLIETLNPREQIVIRLLDLEQRSVQDVCDLTGWGASKVKVTAMRARRKLGEQLRLLDPDVHPES